jgi:DNA-binding NtrC family response regulator
MERGDAMIIVEHHHQGVREMNCLILTRAGFKCESAATVMEAWQLLGSSRCDVLVCSGTDASESDLIQRVRRKYPTTSIIAIGMTALEDYPTGSLTGYDTYIQVPYLVEQLIDAVREALL